MSQPVELVDLADDAGVAVGKAGCCRRSKVAAPYHGLRALWQEFKDFLSQGNVFQLAVAFIMGLQFNAVIESLVNDIIMPPIGAAIGADLTQLFLIIRCGHSCYNETTGQPIEPPPTYTTVAEALSDQAVVWRWGNFIQTVINFVLIALILFLVTLGYSRVLQLRRQLLRESAPYVPVMVECPFCFGSIDSRSKRCKHCTLDSPLAKLD